MNNIYNEPIDITPYADSVTEDGTIILKPERTPLVNPDEVLSRTSTDNFEPTNSNEVTNMSSYTNHNFKFKNKPLLENRLNEK